MKLRTKFSFSAIFLIIIVAASIGVLLYIAEKTLLLQEMETKETSQIKSFAEVCRQSLITEDDLLVVDYMGKIKEAEGVVYAVFVDNNAQVVAHTDNRFIAQPYRGPATIEEYTRRVLSSVEVKYIASTDMPVVNVSLPVILGSERKGVAHIGFSQLYREEKITTTLTQTRNRIVVVGGIALIVGVFGAFILATTMTGPIKKLASGAAQIGKGDLDTVINVKSRDELGSLASDFNSMAQKLKELDRMKQDFMSSVTHELRSPLTAIKGYVNLILEGKTGALSEKQSSYLTIVRNNTARLGRFINDILDLAKIEAGMMDIKAEPIKVHTVSGEIVALMNSIAEERKIKLILDVPEALPEIMADSDRIGQIITNLLGNALKFTPEGGSITVLGREKGDFIEMGVADTGIGMPKEALNKIFSKFEQVTENKGKSRGSKGTGLGLAIARGLVLSHGGKIWVESELNKGTTFFFTLSKKYAPKEGARV
jgi:signal transduction histidine kinase